MFGCWWLGLFGMRCLIGVDWVVSVGIIWVIGMVVSGGV